jgi:hypothetical protein
MMTNTSGNTQRQLWSMRAARASIFNGVAHPGAGLTPVQPEDDPRHADDHDHRKDDLNQEKVEFPLHIQFEEESLQRSPTGNHAVFSRPRVP